MYNQEEKTEKQVTFFRFEDLRIYHKSLDYINWLNDVSMLYPTDDKTQLIQRWNQSARNITFCIAEGSARSKSQFIYYLKMAKSSIRECLVCTSAAYNANNISDTHEDESRGVLMEMTKMIGALISSLQRAQSGNHNPNHNPNGYDNQVNGNSHMRYDETMQQDPNHNNMMGSY
jgi:four helix bundle protein